MNGAGRSAAAYRSTPQPVSRRTSALRGSDSRGRRCRSSSAEALRSQPARACAAPGPSGAHDRGVVGCDNTGRDIDCDASKALVRADSLLPQRAGARTPAGTARRPRSSSTSCETSAAGRSSWSPATTPTGSPARCPSAARRRPSVWTCFTSSRPPPTRCTRSAARCGTRPAATGRRRRAAGSRGRGSRGRSTRDPEPGLADIAFTVTRAARLPDCFFDEAACSPSPRACSLQRDFRHPAQPSGSLPQAGACYPAAPPLTRTGLSPAGLSQLPRRNVDRRVAGP
jgi:hypothetical protein